MAVILMFLLSSMVVLIAHSLYIWRNPKISNGKLPPGSMGLPLVGESIEFFTAYAFNDVQPFIKKRMARYGTLFKTSLVGFPVVVSTDSEFSQYVFQQEGKLFQIQYTKSLLELLGKDGILQFHGTLHKNLKNLILTQVSPQRLKEKLLPEIDRFIRRALASWANLPDVNMTDAVPDMLCDYIAMKLLSYDESKEKKKLRRNFKEFIDGLLSFPLNIPGTTYHACWKGRKNVLKVIGEIYEERKATGIRRNDFLDVVLDEMKKENAYLNRASAIDVIFGLLFAGYETTAQAITLVIKFITANPPVLAKLMEEHEAILKARENKYAESEITWEEYKSMSFTHMVINETLRLANIAPLLFRRATQDLEIHGYTIPRGWLVMICPATTHLNPSKYEDPFAFNPWRWEGREMHAASMNFMPFGGGLRNCVGSDLAKVEMSVFIHYFVTKYRWKIIKGGTVVRKPALVFRDGLHVQVWNKTN